jgi:uncharacterized membrane protein
MLQSLLQWMGYGLCHQLPERSFFGGGVQVSVCARDTGIYIGILLSLAMIAAVHRGSRPRGFPTRAGWVAIALMIGAMAIDGVTEYSGLRPTTNELRLITGLLAGYAIGALIAPMINDELWRGGSRERVLNTPWRLAIWIASVPVAYAAVYWALPLLGVGYPILVAVAIVAALVAVNLIMVCMLPVFERRADTWRQTIAPIAVAIVVAFVEIWLSALLREAFVTTANRIIG